MALKPYYENNHTILFHGDCRDVLPQLNADAFDLVLTDPPYLVNYAGRWGSDWGAIYGDSDPSWVAPVYGELYRVLKPDSLCLTFYGWPHAALFLNAWHLAGFKPVSVFVLIKHRWGLGYFTRGQHEQAYLLAKGRPPKPEEAISDVLVWNQPVFAFHPNQKPVGPLSKLINCYSGDRSVVLDPFCGSGSTLVAARQTARFAIGIEIEERHCETTAIRLSQEYFQFEDSALPKTQRGEIYR